MLREPGKAPRITESDPAVPGETITIYAAGLGLVGPDEAKFATVTGSIMGDRSSTSRTGL